MLRRLWTTAAIIGFASHVTSVHAQDAQDAQDRYLDIGEFDLETKVAFPPHDSLTMRGGGTIEFWVGADWTEDPGYDPTILSNIGPEGPLYLVAMLRDRDGIAFVAGKRTALVPFDFSDDQMHYVALSDVGDATIVMIDGEIIDETDIGFADLPSSGFWIGSADGATSPFVGAIANLRLWDVSVDPDDLLGFAMRDVEAPSAEHPDLDFLIGRSDFTEGGFYLTDFDPEFDVPLVDVPFVNDGDQSASLKNSNAE